MTNLPILLIYTGMLIFDFLVLAGACYLISERGWSAWWMVLAVVICTGSNPKSILTAWRVGAA
jgi:threonine/homoserine/homoserine lactone efflux protein